MKDIIEGAVEAAIQEVRYSLEEELTVVKEYLNYGTLPAGKENINEQLWKIVEFLE